MFWCFNCTLLLSGPHSLVICPQFLFWTSVFSIKAFVTLEPKKVRQVPSGILDGKIESGMLLSWSTHASGLWKLIQSACGCPKNTLLVGSKIVPQSRCGPGWVFITAYDRPGGLLLFFWQAPWGEFSRFGTSRSWLGLGCRGQMSRLLWSFQPNPFSSRW